MLKLSTVPAVLLWSFLAAPHMLAQGDPSVDYTRVLIPIETYVPQPGAFGSQWITRLTLVNVSSTPLPFFPFDSGCLVGFCVPIPLVPQFTFSPVGSRDSDPPGFHGSFVLVQRDRATDLNVILRVQDLSRQSQTWGTSLPTPRENEFLPALSIADIPIAAGFRFALRIYGVDERTTSDVRLQIFGTRSTTTRPDAANFDPDTALAEIRLTLQVPPPTGGRLPSLTPTFAELSALPALPPGNYDRVRFQISAVDPGARIWGFVSVTNDETQHVTVLAP